MFEEFESLADRAMAAKLDAVAEIAKRRRVAASQDENTSIVDSSSLGYREGMTTEVRIAPKWGNAVSGYLRYLRAIDRSENTIYLRSYQLRVFSQALRSHDPWDVQSEDVERFLSNLGTSAGTKRSMLAAIRGFYRYGLRRKFIEDDPTLFIEAIRPPAGKPRPAQEADVRRALDLAEPRVKMMIILGAFVGLRRSEIARVHTTDLRDTLDGPALRILGKGRKERIVPLPGLVASMIEEAEPGWLFPSWHRGQVGSDGRVHDDHLSPGRIGELMREALPPGVTPHMLRHRFASALYAATNSNIRAVQEALGHASVATTQVYTAVPRSALRAGIDIAGSLMA